MKDRIKQIRKDVDLTQQDFADRLGLSRNFIAQCETGAKVPSDRTISDICRIYNVNEDWLRTGAGDPYKSGSMSQRILEYANSVCELDDKDFQKRFWEVFSQLPPDRWKDIEQLAMQLAYGKTEDPEE